MCDLWSHLQWTAEAFREIESLVPICNAEFWEQLRFYGAWSTTTIPFVENSNCRYTDNRQTFLGDGMDWYFEHWKEEVRCLTCGAVRDLRPDSEMMAGLNSVPISVPSHAMVGLGGDTAESPEKYAKEKRLATFIYGLSIGRIGLTPSELFCSDNDTAVGAPSQRAGLGPEHLTTTAGNVGLHFPTIAEYPDAASNEAATELLQASVGSSKFADGFPIFPPWSFPLIPGPAECAAPLGQGAHFSPAGVRNSAIPRVTNGLAVSIVPAKESYAPGEFVTIEISGRNGYVPTNMWIAVQDGELFDLRGNSNRVELNLPEWIGDLSINAWGLDALGRMATSNKVIGLATTQAVVRLDISPAQFRFYPGNEPASPSVSAVYADGVLRRIAPAAPGLEFSIANTNIAELSIKSAIVALAPGKTMLTAMYKTNTSKASVVVSEGKSVVAPLSYAQWSATLPDDQRDPGGTPFGDSIPNAARYVFGLEPRPDASKGNLPRVARLESDPGQTRMVVEYTLGVGVSLNNAIPQVSNDLIHWTNLQMGTNANGGLVYHQGRTVRVIIQVDTPNLFVRIKPVAQ